MIITPLISTLKNLNNILHKCGVEVNTSTCLIDCINCKTKESMRYIPAGYTPVVPDPWFSCNSCGWSGDLLCALACIKGATLSSTVKTMVKNREFGIDGDFLNTEVQKYLESTYDREALNTCWTASSSLERISQLRVDDKKMLQAYGATTFVNDQWEKGINNFAGLASKEEIKDKFGSNVAPKGGGNKRVFLISPITDVPGRISGLAALRSGSSGAKYFDNLLLGELSGDGLMCMPTASIKDETIYACSDLSFVMTAQFKALRCYGETIPFVGYTERTSFDTWKLFPDSKIIFYSRKDDDSIFKSALAAGANAYISSYRGIGTVNMPEDVFVNIHIQEFLCSIEEQAVPAITATKDRIVTMPEIEVSSFIEQLGLTTLQWQDMLSDTEEGSEERYILETIKESGSLTSRVPLIGSRPGLLEIKKNKLFCRGRPIMSVIPVFDRITTFDHQEAVVEGRILTEDKTYPFTLPYKDFSPIWVENKCKDLGHGVKVNYELKSNFEYYIEELSNPERVEGIKTLGWTGEGFTFPAYSIDTNGACSKTEAPVIEDNETKNITPMNTLDKEELTTFFMDPSGKNATYLALVSCALAGVLAYPEDAGPTNIMLTGEHSAEALDRIAADFSLPTFNPESLLNLNFPVTANLGSCEENVKLITERSRSKETSAMLACLDEGLARLAQLCGGWTFVDTSDFSNNIILPGSSYMLCHSLVKYLSGARRVMYSKKNVTPDSNIVIGCLRFIDAHMRSRCGLLRELTKCIVDRACNLITVDTHTRDDAAKRFLYAILYLIESCKVSKMVGEATPSERYEVFITSSSVFINYSRVSKKLRSAPFLLRPDEITTAFEKADALVNKLFDLHTLEGWEIKKEYWEATEMRWHKMSLRPDS